MSQSARLLHNSLVWTTSRGVAYGLSAFGCLALCACGGGEEPKFPPDDSSEQTEEAADESWETGRPKTNDAESDEPEAPVKKGPVPPEFTEGMTVNQAISAVSSEYEFIGLEPEVLGKPLKDIETYKECQVTPASHFTVRIAVWDGKVVGADVKAANKALAECVDRVIRGLEYEEKVLSINTVEYSF